MRLSGQTKCRRLLLLCATAVRPSQFRLHCFGRVLHAAHIYGQ